MRLWLGLLLAPMWAQTAGVRLHVTAAKVSYSLGEAIPLEIRYSADAGSALTADSRLQDRIGRLNGVETFLVDPPEEVEDPLAGTIFGQSGMGGISGGPAALGQKAFVFTRVLNDWLRFRKPGTYRVHVIGHRVAGLTLVSNVLTLTIRPASTEWIRAQIASGDTDTLRYLDTPESAAELARRIGPGNDMQSFQAHLGILGSRHRNRLLPLLEALLIAPHQPVWPRYLDTLSRLEGLVNPGRKTDYGTQLARAMGGKDPAARAVCLQTLTEMKIPIPTGSGTKQ